MAITAPTDITGLVAWMDPSAGTYNGSDVLTALANAGSAGGSFSIIGSPAKGDDVGNFTTLRINSDAKRLTLTFAIATGTMTVVFYGKLLSAGASGVLGMGWPGAGAAKAFYASGSTGIDIFAFGNGCCDVPGHPPAFYSVLGGIGDTDFHTLLWQIGPANALYRDNAAQTITGGSNASATGSMPSTGSVSWDFGSTNTSGENANADIAGILVFNKALSEAERNDLDDWIQSEAAGGSAVAVDVVPGLAALVGAVPTVTVSDHKNVDIVPGSVALRGAAPTVTIGVVVNVVPGALRIAGAVPTVAVSDHKNIDIVPGRLAISGAAPTVTVADESPNIAIVPGRIAISGAVISVSNFAQAEPPPANVELFDTFAPFGSLGGPGDPWVIGVGADPLALDAHLGKDLLLIAEPLDTMASEGSVDLDLFPPFGSLADGWSESGAERRTIYVAATHGRSTANDDEPPAQYVPGRLLPFNFGARLFEGVDPLARPGANQGVIGLIDPDGELNDLIGRVWDGTPLTIKRGVRGTLFRDWPVVGRYRGAGLVRDLDQKQIQLRDNSWPLDGSLHDETYAGTGGVEGTEDITGRRKPWALGHNFNIEPVLLSATDQIFQWSLSSSQELLEFRHGGVPIDIDADYEDYDALAAATIPSGDCATCLALSLVRPNLALEFGVRVDVIGDADTFNGHPAPLTRASIARRIATSRGQNRIDDDSEIDVSSFQRMESRHSAPVGWYFDGEISKAAALNRVLAGILGWWRVRPDGRLTVGWVEAPESLAAAITITGARDDVGKPRLVATSPPRRGTRITWRWNNAPIPGRSSLAGSVSDADAALYARPATYAQSLAPAVASAWPTAALVTVDQAGFRDESDAVAEAARQQDIFGVERNRWARDIQIDPFADLIGSGVGIVDDPLRDGGASVQLCVAIEAVGTSIQTLEFFT